MPQSKQIALLLIATGKYIQFVPQLIEGVKKHFLLKHNIEINLFTDQISEYLDIGNNRVSVTQHLIPPYRFPKATLYRYKIFCSKQYDCDYMYYLDVDMSIVGEVGEEIFGDIVAVRHPGFFKGGGSWETNENSLCYTKPSNRIKYFAGGFQGGRKNQYYRSMQAMEILIDSDEEAGVVPVWHDESVWNYMLPYEQSVTELDPSYCMVEQKELRKKWGIDNFVPKIIALAKDHKNIRE